MLHDGNATQQQCYKVAGHTYTPATPSTTHTAQRHSCTGWAHVPWPALHCRHGPDAAQAPPLLITSPAHAQASWPSGSEWGTYKGSDDVAVDATAVDLHYLHFKLAIIPKGKQPASRPHYCCSGAANITHANAPVHGCTKNGQQTPFSQLRTPAMPRNMAHKSSTEAAKATNIQSARPAPHKGGGIASASTPSPTSTHPQGPHQAPLTVCGQCTHTCTCTMLLHPRRHIHCNALLHVLRNAPPKPQNTPTA